VTAAVVFQTPEIIDLVMTASESVDIANQIGAEVGKKSVP
jgi:hypothetical protein